MIVKQELKTDRGQVVCPKCNEFCDLDSKFFNSDGDRFGMSLRFSCPCCGDVYFMDLVSSSVDFFTHEDD